METIKNYHFLWLTCFQTSSNSFQMFDSLEHKQNTENGLLCNKLRKIENGAGTGGLTNFFVCILAALMDS